jgi:ethanolaminephosphotransferase
MTFFAATWEEYYTGELILPEINGPNEGVVLTALFHLYPVLSGRWDAWLHPLPTAPVAALLPARLAALLPASVPAHALIVALTVAASAATIAVNVRNVWRHQRVAADGSLAVAFTRWVPILLLNAAAFAWILLSPSRILAHAPRMLLWAFAFVSAKLVTQVMLAHLTETEYHPYGKTVGMTLVMLAHGGYLIYAGLSEFLIEELLVWELFLVSFLSYAHLVVHAVWEVSAALGIRVFLIDTAVAREKIKADRSRAAAVAAAEAEADAGAGAGAGAAVVARATPKDRVTAGASAPASAPASTAGVPVKEGRALRRVVRSSKKHD